MTTGQALQAQMLHAALKAGTEIRLNSGVKQLIVEGGRVTGVVTQKNGAEWRIGARLGVLINAGGFARNQRMLDQYIPGTSAEWSNVIAEDTGDMIEEGMRIGAAIAQMGERIGMPVALPPGKPKATMANDVTKPHCITVDQTGVRYMNEAGSSVEYCRKMLERQQTGSCRSELDGVRQPVREHVHARRHDARPEEAAAVVRREVPAQGRHARAARRRLRHGCSQAASDGGSLQRLRASAAATKTFIAASMSTSNGRAIRCASSKSLGPLEQAPFYALQIFPGDVSTYGGLVTDVHARVLRPDGSA